MKPELKTLFDTIQKLIESDDSEVWGVIEERSALEFVASYGDGPKMVIRVIKKGE